MQRMLMKLPQRGQLRGKVSCLLRLFLLPCLLKRSKGVLLLLQVHGSMLSLSLGCALIALLSCYVQCSGVLETQCFQGNLVVLLLHMVQPLYGQLLTSLW